MSMLPREAATGASSVPAWNWHHGGGHSFSEKQCWRTQGDTVQQTEEAGQEWMHLTHASAIAGPLIVMPAPQDSLAEAGGQPGQYGARCAS